MVRRSGRYWLLEWFLLVCPPAPCPPLVFHIRFLFFSQEDVIMLRVALIAGGDVFPLGVSEGGALRRFLAPGHR